MAEFKKTSDAIEKFFKAGWEAVNAGWHDAGRVRYDNVPFREPAGLSWIAVAVREGPGFVSALGVDQHRFGGVVIVQVFTPEDTNPDASRALVDQVGNIFRLKTVIVTASSDRVRFYTPERSEQGLLDGWWQVNVTTPFVRDVQIP